MDKKCIIYNKRNMGGTGEVMCEYLWILNILQTNTI